MVPADSPVRDEAGRDGGQLHRQRRFIHGGEASAVDGDSPAEYWRLVQLRSCAGRQAPGGDSRGFEQGQAADAPHVPAQLVSHAAQPVQRLCHLVDLIVEFYVWERVALIDKRLYPWRDGRMRQNCVRSKASPATGASGLRRTYRCRAYRLPPDARRHSSDDGPAHPATCGTWLIPELS